MTTKKKALGWSDVKSSLKDFDRGDLLALVHDLYAAGKDNRDFLHARFAPGEDVLTPYRAVITRWINPPDPRKPMSVAKAKKAIADYRKAVGEPKGLADLSVFYCEEVFVFLGSCGMDDERFYDALVRMFEQALTYTMALPENTRAPLVLRLDAVRRQGQNVGWGVGDDFDDRWLQAGFTPNA